MPTQAWHEAVIQAFKDNNVRLVVYVPDNVLRPLIEAVHADDFFTTFVATREEEAVGIVCGAAMAGLRGVVLGVQGVEVLFKAMIGRHAGIDRTANRLDGPAFHGRRSDGG